MVFVLYWYKSNWALKFDSLEWSQMISEIGIIGSGAIGIYEAVKKIIQGSKAIAENVADLRKRNYGWNDENPYSDFTPIAPEDEYLIPF